MIERATTGPKSGAQAEPGDERQVPVWSLAIAFWSVFAIFAAVHTYVEMLSHGHSFARILFFELVLCAYWAVATLAIAPLARRFPLPPLGWRSGAAHLLAAAVLLVVYPAWVVVADGLLRPYAPVGALGFGHYRTVLSSQAPFAVVVYAATLGALYALMLRARALRTLQLEREVARARLAALSLQLQPHFLFNALHAVTGLIRGGEDRAAISTVAAISDILRYALDGDGADQVTLAEEIEMTRRYLTIEGLRYQDRLSVSLDVATDAGAACVPRLLLQPLVENAIRHGVAANSGNAWLELSARREGDTLRIELANSSRGGGGQEGFGIGLQNTRARLAQLYGTGQELAVRRHADRFELSLALPWRIQEERSA